MTICCFLTFSKYKTQIQNSKKKWYWIIGISPKQNFKRKFIVNSLRLLHKKILYFEIGSKQVANNGNNFCNKHILERWKKNNDKQKMERHVPKAQKQIRHEFNNFATHYHMLLIVNKSTPNTLKQTNHNYFTKLLHKFFC